MANTEDLATYAARLATFERPHHFAKRRASSAKKKAQSAVTWPHTDPAGEDLAKAGFYYKPSTSNPDSVTCFLCEKALDGWEAGDNPATEHLSHVPDCGWAINVCIELRSQDMDRAEEDPMSEKMVESRRATFRDAWPHEGRKGWKCKTQKMVDAGWCYTPLPEADDCVHCFYCGVSLDGWEPKDDPWDEHRKRAPECHFFTLVDESAKLKKQAKRGKGRTSRASRASRLSTQSNVTLTSEAPAADDLEEDSVAEGDTMMTTTSTTFKATKGGKKAPKRAAPKKGRATRTRQGSVTAESIVEEASAAEPDLELEPSVASPAAVEPVKPLPKARAKRQPKQAASSQVEEDTSVLEQQQPVRKVSRAKTRKQQKAVDDSQVSQVEIDEHVEEAAPPVPAKSPKRATRGKKRTSDGLEKLDDSIMVIEPSQTQSSMTESQTQGRKRGRPSKQPNASQDQIEEGHVPESQSQQQPQPQPKKRGRPSKQSLEARAAEASVEAVKPPATSNEAPDAADEPAPAPARGKSKANKGRAPSKQQAPEPPAEESVVAETRPDQKEPSDNEPEQLPPPNSLPPARQSSHRSPTASPQSSDAENQPPSSRPSFGASQQHHVPASITCIPLAATTPRTSPSKRNIISQLSTSIPWKAVDLETVFLPSPGRQTDKENQTADIEGVLQRLSSPEKKMSVEDWILWNAKGAEEKLRGECERMIGAFETEGNRALQSLEGIQTM